MVLFNIWYCWKLSKMSGNMRNERLEQIFADHKIMLDPPSTKGGGLPTVLKCWGGRAFYKMATLYIVARADSLRVQQQDLLLRVSREFICCRYFLSQGPPFPSSFARGLSCTSRAPPKAFLHSGHFFRPGNCPRHACTYRSQQVQDKKICKSSGLPIPWWTHNTYLC